MLSPHPLAESGSTFFESVLYIVVLIGLIVQAAVVTAWTKIKNIFHHKKH